MKHIRINRKGNLTQLKAPSLSQITTPTMVLLPRQSGWFWASNLTIFIAVGSKMDPGLTATLLGGLLCKDIRPIKSSQVSE